MHPWKAETVISYELPKASDVKVTILDITGKVIRVKTVKGEEGSNSVMLTREELGGATGVLVYKLESGIKAIQSRMVVVD
jgi:hypothetical protein